MSHREPSRGTPTTIDPPPCCIFCGHGSTKLAGPLAHVFRCDYCFRLFDIRRSSDLPGGDGDAVGPYPTASVPKRES